MIRIANADNSLYIMFRHFSLLLNNIVCLQEEDLIYRNKKHKKR